MNEHSPPASAPQAARTAEYGERSPFREARKEPPLNRLLPVTRMQEQLDLAGVTETIGRERFFPTVSAAVEGFQAQECTGSITDRDDSLGPSGGRP